MIHSHSYGGAGPWAVDFEIEAEGPTSPVTGVFPHPGVEVDWVRDVEGLLRWETDLTAWDVAIRTGGQFIGILAEKDTGMVVRSDGEPEPESERFLWTELNQGRLLQ